MTNKMLLFLLCIPIYKTTKTKAVCTKIDRIYGYQKVDLNPHCNLSCNRKTCVTESGLGGNLLYMVITLFIVVKMNNSSFLITASNTQLCI